MPGRNDCPSALPLRLCLAPPLSRLFRVELSRPRKEGRAPPQEERLMSNLERAIAIAAEAHAGQQDKAGAPYILHPLRVMLRLSSNDERIVGVLHDVCEDCPGWTLDRLRSEGFAKQILTAQNSVTKRVGETYENFVRR